MEVGEILKVGTHQYRLTKCRPFEKCVLCKKENNVMPCIIWAAIVKREFSVERCNTDIPNDIYPKQI